MSSSNNRFGRRTSRQSGDLRAEPVLSFKPGRDDGKREARRPPPRPDELAAMEGRLRSAFGKSEPASPRIEREDAKEFGARGGNDPQRDPIPSFMRGSQRGPHVDREDAEEFGMAGDGNDRLRIERDDDFDPRARPEKAMEQRVPESERPLYHHLFDERENRRRGFGWIAALGSVAVVAIGVAYAWHNFMARPAPANLFEPGVASRGPASGYTTPAQPATDADKGSGADLDAGSAPAMPPAAAEQQPTKDVATVSEPKSVPAEAPPPPKKTISEAAANPGSLGPAANPQPAPPPAPSAAKKQPAAAPAPTLTPPKREAAKPETPRHETPRREASIAPPRPAPAPQDTAPEETAAPVMTQPAAAPAVTAPPPRRHRQATGQPQPLNREAPTAYAPPPQQQPAQQQQQPSNMGPPPGAPETVTIDGVNYVNGQEPHSLGTLNGPPQAAGNDAALPPDMPPMPMPSAPPAYSTRPYTPSDHDGGAPLPNDVVILPNGQMAVPNRP